MVIKADYLNADVDRAIGIVAKGLRGKISVNKQSFNSIMPRQILSDEDIANVLTYVLNNWDNKVSVSPQHVEKVKNRTAL